MTIGDDLMIKNVTTSDFCMVFQILEVNSMFYSGS